MQLEARLAAERAPAIRADLGRDAEPAQQREGAARDRGARRRRRWSATLPRPAQSGGCRRSRASADELGEPAARRCGSIAASFRPRTRSGERQFRAAWPRLRARAAAACSRRRARRRSPMPSAATTRWHGTKMGSRLRAQNEPAARWAPGRPASAASSPYETTSPRGTAAAPPPARAGTATAPRGRARRRRTRPARRAKYAARADPPADGPAVRPTGRPARGSSCHTTTIAVEPQLADPAAGRLVAKRP